MATNDIGLALLHDCGFGRSAFAESLPGGTLSKRTIDMAADAADRAGSPVGVWVRDGWATLCDVSPDLLPIDPVVYGWEMWAVMDPQGAEE